MKFIDNETTQVQIVAMVKAAAEVEIHQAQEQQDREMLEELERMIAQGEKLSPNMQRHLEALRRRFGG